jgi:hypothetical protein
MIDAKQVLAEQRPMLEQFLIDVGLHRPGEPLDLRGLVGPLDAWLASQEIGQGDVAYVAARIAAYLSLYLVECFAGEQVVVANRIFIRLPVVAGVFRELDLYGLSYNVAREKPCQFRKALALVTPVSWPEDPEPGS